MCIECTYQPTRLSNVSEVPSVPRLQARTAQVPGLGTGEPLFFNSPQTFV